MVLLDFGAQPLLLLEQLGRKLSPEILGLEHQLAQLQRDQSPLAGRNDRSGPHTRESDLLAFEITIERSQPGSVMGGCYNKINGDYAGGNKVLLEDVLKGARGLRDVRLGRDPEMGVRAQIFPVRLTNAS